MLTSVLLPHVWLYHLDRDINYVLTAIKYFHPPSSFPLRLEVALGCINLSGHGLLLFQHLIHPKEPLCHVSVRAHLHVPFKSEFCLHCSGTENRFSAVLQQIWKNETQMAAGWTWRIKAFSTMNWQLLALLLHIFTSKRALMVAITHTCQATDNMGLSLYEWYSYLYCIFLYLWSQPWYSHHVAFLFWHKQFSLKLHSTK